MTFVAVSLSKFGLNQTGDVAGLAPNKETKKYIPHTDPNYAMSIDLVREVCSFLNYPCGDSLMLVGPTGSGKTSGINQILGRLNWPVISVNAHGRMEFGDLVGQFRLCSSQPGLPPETQFVHGPLALAMKIGAVLLINEVDYMDPSESAGLNDVLEGNPLVIAENGAEVIQQHPHFRIICTCNTGGRPDETGLYLGAKQQNIAFLDRFRMSIVSYMAPATEILIARKFAPKNMPDKLVELCVASANAIRTQFLGSNGDGSDATLSTTMSTRTLIRWIGLIGVFRNHDAPIKYALHHAMLNGLSRVDSLAVEQIVRTIFGSGYQQRFELKNETNVAA